MIRIAAILFCLLLLASCASVQPTAAVVQSGQVRAALENRHGWIPATHDDEYATTDLDALWRANVDTWKHEVGETWDCEDNAEALLNRLRLAAVKRGDNKAPAAFLMPAIMRDGRRHAVVVALCHTADGATWNYWDASNLRQVGRAEIAGVLK